jgi:hypothetical protein
VSANRKKGFYTSHLPKNEDISGTIVFSASELWTLFKPIAVDVLFEAYPIQYPMIPLSCRSNLAGWDLWEEELFSFT